MTCIACQPSVSTGAHTYESISHVAKACPRLEKRCATQLFQVSKLNVMRLYEVEIWYLHTHRKVQGQQTLLKPFRIDECFL